MKRVLGLDLGNTSIGWALVNEATEEGEKSSIIRIGVRVNPLTADELADFEKGKTLTTNAGRRLKKSMRRNLQRYKLRRENLIAILKQHGFINDNTILCEEGNQNKYETHKLRAKAAAEIITLEELARVLLMINKKRGYKSNRKIRGTEDGQLIDGIAVSKKLHEKQLTPGEYCLQSVKAGKKSLPDFYRSDIQQEYDRIWEKQRTFYPDILTEKLKEELVGQNRNAVWEICSKYFVWTETTRKWNPEKAAHESYQTEHGLKGIYTQRKKAEAKLENLQWRADGLKEQLSLEQLAIVLQDLGTLIHQSSSYLGAISDRSKELYFHQKTVGQYQTSILENAPNTSLRNMVFYRQDYINEFETIWKKQAEYHKELTEELKKEIRDSIIFYQRRLRSKKGEVAFCEFESRQIKTVEKGKKEEKQTITVGQRVAPRSSPLFQEFKIWQSINNLEIYPDGKKKKTKKKAGESESADTAARQLTQAEKELLAAELSIREKMTKAEVLKLLHYSEQGADLNYKELSGNKTGAILFQTYSRMIEMYGYEPLNFKLPAADVLQQAEATFKALGWNTDILRFDPSQDLDRQAYFLLWHLLYSFEGDNTPTGNERLVQKLCDEHGLEKECATALANVVFDKEYGSLSTKAIRKILPHLKAGQAYDKACEAAGYRHSKHSLTKEEIASKKPKDRLEEVRRNELRNPVVEKILNQMVNVVNAIIETYGSLDEIRLEMARELKLNATKRAEESKRNERNMRTNETYRNTIKEEFGFSYVSKQVLERYKLWLELKPNGYKTLYSNTYIPKELLFTNQINIEHIIPKQLLFDNSISNKTLELHEANLRKGNKTAYDFMATEKDGEGLAEYVRRCEVVFKDNPRKLKNLLTPADEIQQDFIARDLNETQYITRKALFMLQDVCDRVVSTTGKITEQLRDDWQLTDLMKELNWEKYKAAGLTEYHKNKDGQVVKRIKDWSKRNDHRHHAVDALTVAFTKDAFVQYFNNRNASEVPDSNEYFIKKKYFRNQKAILPIPDFRAQAKMHLENTLISIKAKNKVTTPSTNTIRREAGEEIQITQTPRGQLHMETVYGLRKLMVIKQEKVNADFDEAKIKTVKRPDYKKALLKRLEEHDGDPKKAFTGKNALNKMPLWIDEDHTQKVPAIVEMHGWETVYTIRKPVDPDLNVEKVIDPHIRRLLQERLLEYGNNTKKAFSNLDKNPIWMDKKRGIAIKRVTISGISNGEPLRIKRDKYGKPMLDENGHPIPTDFVNTGSNHHVAVYRKPATDKQGQPLIDEYGRPEYQIEDTVTSFLEAVRRATVGDPIIDKTYNRGEGWHFLYSMKQNEYFVFPNQEMGFDPHETDLLDEENYSLISPNLFRLQKFSKNLSGNTFIRSYVFRHHLETMVKDTSAELKGKTWTKICSTKDLAHIVKVRIDHLGRIVSIGEY